MHIWNNWIGKEIMKFVTRTLLLLVLTVSLLVSCGGEKKNNTATSAKSTVQTTLKTSKQEAKRDTRKPGDVIDLTRFDLHQLDGKVRVYEMWGVWCRPCIMSMPKVQEMWEKYRDNDNFELLVVNTGWRGDSMKRVKDWLGKNPQYNFPVYFDPNHSLPTKYGVNSIPRTVILGKDNKVRFNDHPMKIPADLLDNLLAE